MQAGPCKAWLLRGRASRSIVYFPGGSRVPCNMVHCTEGSPSDRWPPSFLAKSGGAIPSIGHPAPVILLLVELVMSRLLGHNQQPTVPGVQDPEITQLVVVLFILERSVEVEWCGTLLVSNGTFCWNFFVKLAICFT
jgi:hypothetical protein